MPAAENSLDGRVAIVTGASSGIGASLVQQLVQAGVRCIGVGRRADRLQALGETLREGYFQALSLDVREEKTPDEILHAIPQGWNAPDILINNAGLALGTAPAPQCSLDEWLTMIDTNVTSLVRLTHRLLPTLIAAPRADIMNLSSVAASYPYPGGNTYGATKAFVRQFSLGLKADLLGTNVRVTSVEPGMVDTEFSTVRFAGDSAKAQKVYEGMQPLTSSDIAETIVGILSLPSHVSVNTIEIMPTSQAFGPFAVHRESDASVS